MEFAVEPGRVFLRKRVSPETLHGWQAYEHRKPPAGSVDELMEQLRGLGKVELVDALLAARVLAAGQCDLWSFGRDVELIHGLCCREPADDDRRR